MERSDINDGRTVLRLARLSGREPIAFDIRPDATARAALVRDLELIGLPKLRFSGELRPEGPEDWRLEADLGATVVQSCVITLAPVTTRIDEHVSRLYVRDLPEPEPGEIEMPEDETVETLPEELSFADVLSEALALALPAYPRAADVTLEDAQFTEPGQAPMTDEDARPFAGLKDLRDKLTRDE